MSSEHKTNLPPSSDRRSGVGWPNVFGIAFFAIVCSLAVYGTYFLKHVPGENAPFEDTTSMGLRSFHNQVYFPVRALVTGENPYSKAYVQFHPDSALGQQVAMDPAPPSALLILSPLAFLQIQVAEVVYISICVLLAIFCAYLLLRAATERSPTTGGTMLTAALMMVCLPGVEAFVVYPTIMITFLGVLLTIEYSNRHDLLSGVGIVLAFCHPVIGTAMLVLTLFRRHFSACAFGILLLIGSNLVACAWIGNNTDRGVAQSIEEARGLYSSFYQPVIPLPVENSAVRVDAYSVVARVLATNPWVEQQTNLHCYVATGILLLALIALLSERDDSQKRGLISRSGMLMATVTILYFHQTTTALYLLWIPAIGLLVDGRRSEQAFSLPMRFVLGLLVVLPLFNYVATPLVMQRLEISRSGTADSGAAPVSLRALFESWEFSNPDLAQWQTVVTINSVLIALAVLLIAFRMLLSFWCDRDIIEEKTYDARYPRVR